MAISYFSSAYFWDCKNNEIFLDTHFKLVIERVLSQSLILKKDIVNLEHIYHIDLIISIAKNSQQIFGNERIEFISIRYNIGLNNFLRYYHQTK
jgi:hypothetical protein